MTEESWNGASESSDAPISSTANGAAGEDERFVLISYIKIHPAIWNPNDENYKNLLERKKIFSEIAQLLTARGIRSWTEDNVKVAWKRLIDSQRRIAQRKRNSSESLHSAWPYWNAMSFTLHINNSGMQPMSLPYVHNHRSPYELPNHQSPSNSTLSRAESPVNVKVQFDDDIGSMNATQSVQAAIDDVLHNPSQYSPILHSQASSSLVSVRESSAILGDFVADSHRNLIRQGQLARAQTLRHQILATILEFERS